MFMDVTYIKKIMHNMICTTGVYSRQIINMLFICQVCGLVENFNFRIYSDIINVINVKLCMMVSKYYLLNFTCSCLFQCL